MMKKSNFFLFLTLIFSCFSIFNTTIIIKNKRKDQMISAVSGYTIFIDPGHGGKDNGASFNDVLEDEINLSIATKVYEMLIDLGARTLISRVDDYDLSDVYAKNHKIQDLKKRIAYMKENQADLFVSIHLNSFSNSDVSGAQVFYKKNVPSSEEFALSGIFLSGNSVKLKLQYLESLLVYSPIASFKYCSLIFPTQIILM